MLDYEDAQLSFGCKSRAKIVAITSYPDSDLGEIADYVVEIRGERRSPKRYISFSDRSPVGKRFAPLRTLSIPRSFKRFSTLFARLDLPAASYT